MKKLLLLLLILPLWYFVISNSKQETPKMLPQFTQKTVANPISLDNILSGGVTPTPTVDWNQTNAPNYIETGGGSGSGTSSSQAIDPNLLSQYDQSINNTQAAIGRLPDQFNSGVSGIDSSYQNALNQLLGAKNQAQKTSDQNILSNKQDYVGGKNTIRSNAGASLSGLLRLLGSRGAGGSSAAKITAPGAVARNATLQSQDLSGTFGKNSQALDTNWANYLQGYDNQVSSATNQRDQSKQSLQGQIDTNRANLLQTLASLSGQKAAYSGGDATAASQPYLDQANSILDSASRYNVAPINYKTEAYNAPSLDKYTVNSSAKPTFNGQAAGNDYFSPYLAALLGKKQQFA